MRRMTYNEQARRADIISSLVRENEELRWLLQDPALYEAEKLRLEEQHADLMRRMKEEE